MAKPPDTGDSIQILKSFNNTKEKICDGTEFKTTNTHIRSYLSLLVMPAFLHVVQSSINTNNKMNEECDDN